jgi:hypothetical protein
MGEIVPPKSDDTVAWVTVRMHAPGTISIQGTIGDRDFALDLLAHAADAIRNQVKPKGELYIPSRDVEARPYDGLRPVGDMAAHERGDA